MDSCLSRMEAGHTVHAYIQALSCGNSLIIKHIRRQLDIHEVETLGEEGSCSEHERKSN